MICSEDGYRGEHMITERLDKVKESMKAAGIPQLIVSDPVVIDYLSDVMIQPGERFLALLIREEGEPVLILNDLFPFGVIEGTKVVWYNDIQDAVTLLNDYILPEKTIAVDKNWSARFLLRLQELQPTCRFVNSSFIIDYVRMIKTPEEQEKMIRSSKTNDKVMQQLIPLVNQGYDELELNALCRKLYEDNGCEGVSFDPITAFAYNAADPHHGADHTKGKYGDCVVLDIGGMQDGYASDMTRTVFLGEVSERQKEIYNIVLEANLRGIAAAKPGNRMCDVDLAARNYIESKGYGKYFTHRTGHSIGREDHEFGDVSSVNTDVIRVGQCFSVEPGIYLPEEGIGVRIEDLVLITEDGCKVLNDFTKEIIVLPFEKEV